MVALVALCAGAATGVIPIKERWWARGMVCIGVAACGSVYLCSAFLPLQATLFVILFLALAGQALFIGFINWPTAHIGSFLPYLYAATLALYAALLLAISLAFSSMPGLLGRGSFVKESFRMNSTPNFCFVNRISQIMASSLRGFSRHPECSYCYSHSIPSVYSIFCLLASWSPVCASLTKCCFAPKR